jgi:ABC-type phosphate transport system substrate-binding protein
MAMIRNFIIAVGLVATLLVCPGPSLAGELVVIVNKANPTSAMNKDEVRNHYLKKQSSWSNGEKLRPVDTESSGQRLAFVHKLLGMTSNEELERYWLELKYQKAEAPPKRVEGDTAVIKFVSTFKGGIGFVEAASLDAEAKTKVQVVLTVKY